jgi:hypothetical protein
VPGCCSLLFLKLEKANEFDRQESLALPADQVLAIIMGARNDEDRTSARKILKARGARLVVFFGQFVTEVLEA